MTNLTFLLMALVMIPAVSTAASTDDLVITVDQCRAQVAHHGVPDADPVITFQGGSLEAKVVDCVRAWPTVANATASGLT